MNAETLIERLGLVPLPVEGGCFDPADFESGDRERLSAAYPEFAEMIRDLTA